MLLEYGTVNPIVYVDSSRYTYTQIKLSYNKKTQTIVLS